MPIDPVASATFAPTTPAAGANAKKQSMDSEVFMSLLVSQLRNQDPSAPMDTNQMISQTTQLAMMEKITQMTGLSEENFHLQMRSSAAALIGNEVSYTGTDGTAARGLATAVSYSGPVPTVTIDGKSIALDLVSGVGAVPSPIS
ncbi:flagellar hook capping FlgD N-terminal domain-containing protein [Arthrobacter agilis]|uniref:flagellar hook assembly protein FlgD n=1 Tax=Arthrobacter agilis TaxID=37921 RepID=UPI0023666043|nr:flagellar hook capping FlgD N-terminal domain-containing protein [Arthrobacter agilis]WDF33768.1 flagellar hook capping FlgD N-terminal domain-containing protein [Arthrobacter agilis]